MIERGHLKLLKSSRESVVRSTASPEVSSGVASLDRRRTVLVVEPSAMLAESIATELGDRGFRVILVQRGDFDERKAGDQAMAIIRREHIDAMVLEFDIQDIRGDVLFELASAYQPHLRTSTVFIVSDASEAVLRLIRACNCQWLRKPFDVDSLAATIEKLMS